MPLPTFVTVVEVGPRDGLQNEKQLVSLEHKQQLVNSLSQTGLQHIETGSFVAPKWVPQMATSSELFASIEQNPAVRYSALVPNQRGLDAALAANVKEIALFAAATEAFSQKNLNCSVAESLERFVTLAKQARDNGMQVRGYVSCVLGCPYDGDVSPDAVNTIVHTLLEAGCYEVSLGDTIGIGTAGSTERLLSHLLATDIQPNQLAMHCHDTYGQALANILMALQHGIATIDASVAGLGGCPYAKGATGNVATEDVLYMLNGLGIEHGVDLDAIVDIGYRISEHIGKPNQSRVAKALLNQRGD